ncbi:STAS domain-containing protein [Catellatospora sp. KI3]|uniref:STAS domain-containing protein n=1 Tax=Catellatospora sp. KI3 TaxID=3041620 RepID=UPI0024823711|nr:STAS domain-containing protein [Catellatospora sp. KI3]MDI1460707.1 STAS domain-containing protein [Catellatospora sp. KI3]
MSGNRTTKKWTQLISGRTAVLVLSGELDLATVEDLERFLDGMRHTGADCVVLDLSEVSFIDCQSMRIIGHAALAALSTGMDVRVVGLSNLSALVFRVCGLGELLPAEGPG